MSEKIVSIARDLVAAQEQRVKARQARSDAQCEHELPGEFDFESGYSDPGVLACWVNAKNAGEVGDRTHIPLCDGCKERERADKEFRLWSQRRGSLMRRLAKAVKDAS